MDRGGTAQHTMSSRFLFEDPDEGLRIERESRKWRVIGRWKHNLLANGRRMRTESKGRTIKAQVTETGRNLRRHPLRAGCPSNCWSYQLHSPVISRQVIRVSRLYGYAELGKFLNYESVSVRLLHTERNAKHRACQMTLQKRNYIPRKSDNSRVLLYHVIRVILRFFPV